MSILDTASESPCIFPRFAQIPWSFRPALCSHQSLPEPWDPPGTRSSRPSNVATPCSWRKVASSVPATLDPLRGEGPPAMLPRVPARFVVRFPDAHQNTLEVQHAAFLS